jgi:hypothetical protein
MLVKNCAGFSTGRSSALAAKYCRLELTPAKPAENNSAFPFAAIGLFLRVNAL